MQGQPKGRNVEEVFAQLDQNWQELVKVIKEGRGQPSAPRGQDQGFAPQEAVQDIKEGPSPSMPDNSHRQVGPAIPEALEPGQPEVEMPPPSPALEPPPKKLPPKSWGQKFFNVAILALLVATAGGELFLLAQTQWGGGKIATGMLTICGKDGVRRAYLGERDGQINLCLLDKAGRTRVDVSLDAAGSPSLCLIDELQQNRVELKMGPGGEPVLRQVKKPALPVGPESKTPVAPGNETTAPAVAASETAASQAPKTEATLPENPGNDKSATIAPAGQPANQGPGPVSGLPGATGSTAPSPVPTVKFVGSKTSNKYHYPDCKFAKQIRPGNLVTFSSVEEARQKGYVPCPACKAPKSDLPPGN